MVGHLKDACLKAQFAVIENTLDESDYWTKERLISNYPNYVGFFPHEVKQVAYKNHAKYPIKQATKTGILVQCWKAGAIARYSFSLKIVESMIDQLLEKNNEGFFIVNDDLEKISKPFKTDEEAKIELLRNDRYGGNNLYNVSYFKAVKND